MKLYDINYLMELYFDDLVDPETGEINEEVEKQLESLDIDRTEKIENTCCLIKNIRAEAKAVKDEMDNLDSRYKALMNKADRTENWLSTQLKDGEKPKMTKADIGWRKSERTEIVDEDKIPEKYMKFVTKGTPDKTLIKDAIKSGEEVPGAVVITTNNMKVK